MTISESERHQLYQRLAQVLGENHALTLMTMLPPFDWTELATKADIEALRVATGRDIDELRTELKGDISELRHEFDGLRHEFDGLRHEFDGLRHEFDGLRGEFAQLRVDIRDDMAQLELRIEREMRGQLKSIIYANASFMAAAGSLAFGLAQLT